MIYYSITLSHEYLTWAIFICGIGLYIDSEAQDVWSFLYFFFFIFVCRYILEEKKREEPKTLVVKILNKEMEECTMVSKKYFLMLI